MPSFRDFVAALDQLSKHQDHTKDASGASKALLIRGYRASPALASELNIQPLQIDRRIVNSAKRSLDGRDEPDLVQLALPLDVRPGVGARGLDLQLRLFQLTIGEPLEPNSEAWQRRRQRHEDIGEVA